MKQSLFQTMFRILVEEGYMDKGMKDTGKPMPPKALLSVRRKALKLMEKKAKK